MSVVEVECRLLLPLKLGLTSPPAIGLLPWLIESMKDFQISIPDVHNLQFDNEFNYTMGAFSDSFFPSPVLGLEQIRKCLVDRGEVVMSAWGDEDVDDNTLRLGVVTILVFGEVYSRTNFICDSIRYKKTIGSSLNLGTTRLGSQNPLADFSVPDWSIGFQFLAPGPIFNLGSYYL
jgi:hypothetical protein